MLKYKDTYFVLKPKDSNGNYTKNKDDNYIKCKKAEIYRYNPSILVVQFYSNKYANLRLKELSDVGIQLKPFQIGDDEQTYLFPESDLSKVADIVKAKKRVKKNYTEEQRNVLRERMKSLHKIDRK